MIEAEEQRFVQKLIAHLRVERFADPVLHRFARRDEVPGDARLLAPGQHRVRGELGAVIADDQVGLSAPGDERRQFPCNAPARDRCVDDGRQAFLGDIVGCVANVVEIAEQRAPGM